MKSPSLPNPAEVRSPAPQHERAWPGPGLPSDAALFSEGERPPVTLADYGGRGGAEPPAAAPETRLATLGAEAEGRGRAGPGEVGFGCSPDPHFCFCVWLLALSSGLQEGDSWGPSFFFF